LGTGVWSVILLASCKSEGKEDDCGGHEGEIRCFRHIPPRGITGKELHVVTVSCRELPNLSKTAQCGAVKCRTKSEVGWADT
jgi:hypothetical protein